MILIKKLPLSAFFKGEFIIDFSKREKSSKSPFEKVRFRGIFVGQVFDLSYLFLYMSELLSSAQNKIFLIIC